MVSAPAPSQTPSSSPALTVAARQLLWYYTCLILNQYHELGFFSIPRKFEFSEFQALPFEILVLFTDDVKCEDPNHAAGEFVFNNGAVFNYRNGAIDCDFYDIDCGCVFRGRTANARLACIRLEDHALFYV